VKKIASYLSLVKFSHTIFAMPFALVGFFLAVHENGSFPDWEILALIVLCMIFARNAAMAFNRLADYKIDAANPRTANREIPVKKISPKAAALFTIVNSLLFILATALINKTVLFLSPVALLVVLSYSYTKRFTFFAHIILGVGLSIAPAGAYLAVNQTLPLTVILLSAVVLLWTAGFDILYSLQDEEFDRENKLFSIPAKFGRLKSLYISAFLHLFCAALLIIFTILIYNNFLSIAATSIFLTLLLYQHFIVKKDDISRINLAFGTLNGMASVIFALLTIWSMYYTA
jgi:4-hydroxybenzoate polyprenyltransferase